jgi:hypothetical protein
MRPNPKGAPVPLRLEVLNFMFSTVHGLNLVLNLLQYSVELTGTELAHQARAAAARGIS